MSRPNDSADDRIENAWLMQQTDLHQRGIEAWQRWKANPTLAAWPTHGRQHPAASIVLIDEAHKSMASTYQKLLALYPNAVVIGFTATPARKDGKCLSDFFQWIECIAPPSQLIREGWILRPEVYAPMELAAMRKVGKKIQGLAGDPVMHWKKHANGLPTIAFASKVPESVALRNRFLDKGIPAEHIDADSSDDDRDAAYKRLASGQTLILSSVGLLIEGVDIPEAACALLWAKFGSMVSFRQACGRVLRPCEGKTRAVVLDHSGAAAIHGLPGDDVEWSLDASSTLATRRKKAIEEGRQHETGYCGGCGAAFQGAACQLCGWRRPQQRKASNKQAEDAYKATDEPLTRFSGEMANIYAKEERARDWKRYIAIAVAKGQKAGAAAAMFSRKHNIKPWEAGVSPLPDDRGDWQRPAADVFPGFKRKGGAA